jgi:hypothetical protein
MGNNTRIALAMALGYLLGRQQRLGTALAFGAAVAAGRISQDPAAALKLGGEMLGKSPVLGRLTELTKPLTAAGKAAATGAVSKGIDSVGDRIRRRADALRVPGGKAEPEEAAAPDEDEQADRRGADDRETKRSRRDEAEVADDEAEVTDEYDEDEDELEEEEEPEQEEESEAPAAQRSPSERTVGPRRKPAPDDLDEGARRRARRPDRERSNAGGAPVRRRASKP